MNFARNRKNIALKAWQVYWLIATVCFLANAIGDEPLVNSMAFALVPFAAMCISIIILALSPAATGIIFAYRAITSKNKDNKIAALCIAAAIMLSLSPIHQWIFVAGIEVENRIQNDLFLATMLISWLALSHPLYVCTLLKKAYGKI